MKLSEEDLRKAREFCEDELSSYMLYLTLAQQERGKLAEQLRQAAEQEKDHYEFWRSVVGSDCSVRPPGRAFRILYRVFGPVFTLQALERRERRAAEEYGAFRDRLPEEMRPALDRIIADEESHESDFLKGLEDVRVRYLGFVALGMADAITELMGVYAGFLGATMRTLVVGLAGLLVSLPAAVSMAAAAYLQARQEGHVSPGMSALATGLSYFVVALVLAMPYFLTRNIVIAMTASVLLGVAALAAFHFYSSTVNGVSFRRELAIGLAILLAAVAVGLLFGELIGMAFHLRVLA